MTNQSNRRNPDPVPARPTRGPERELARKIGGSPLVAGIDEAGRGPLAGPVVAAAVVWPDDSNAPKGVNDSKQLRPDERSRLFHAILQRATAVAAGIATAREIDRINIYQATRLAAQRAIDALAVKPQALVTDALTIPSCNLPTEPIVKGDCKSVSIAAASIIAKVIRDRLMDWYDTEFPGFHWHSNRGYPTPEHFDALNQFGPTTLHRITFSGVSFFSDRLQPSQTLRTLIGSPETSLREHMHTQGSAADPLPLAIDLTGLMSAPTAHHAHPVASLLAESWDPQSLTTCRLAFLSEIEREALDAFLSPSAALPSWWPQ